MTDDNTNQKKRKLKWNVPYSKMSLLEAEKRLGFALEDLTAVSVDSMLANTKHSLERDVILSTKEMVYHHILQYLQLEGYPTEASPDFKEANVSDLVLYIIGPIVTEFKRKTGRNVRLRREKEIISTDNETGGMEEFVVMDRISVEDNRFVVIMEAKKVALGEGMKQCLLSLKDARDNNGGGEVYGFVTTGSQWQMIRYDGTSFISTEEFTVLFRTMGTAKERWMNDYSVVVDCMYAALDNGGIVKRD
ncbi:hypothetical protein DFP73DRAFT_561263 [Morchella snyderi]|nr:hypothetical protein DFP73DRAFT_561263 [Morchella snyderi]